MLDGSKEVLPGEETLNTRTLHCCLLGQPVLPLEEDNAGSWLTLLEKRQNDCQTAYKYLGLNFISTRKRPILTAIQNKSSNNRSA